MVQVHYSIAHQCPSHVYSSSSFISSSSSLLRILLLLLSSFSSRTREDLRAAHHRINTMLADYGDVVPRREFEMLETSYKASNLPAITVFLIKSS